MPHDGQTQGARGWPNILGLLRATSVKVLGKPGATAGGALAGGTTSGAPTSGEFEAGDAVVAQNGHLWICTVSGTPGTWVDVLAAASSGLYSAYLCYQDQKSQNTAGGTFTTGAWRTRDLTTEVADTANHGTLASNQVTLDAGTYVVRAACPAYYTNEHQARVQNITDSATLLVGTAGYSASASSGWVTHSFVSGRFTIAAAKVIELQHQSARTQATNGLGVPCNFGTEIYSTLELWKE